MTTPTELEAAVEQVTAAPALVEWLAASCDRMTPLTRYGEDAVFRPARGAVAAMADAANTISALLAALAASEARRGELEAELNAYRRAVNGKPARETIMRDAGRGPISRLLNPQQEGSRDHGR